MINPVSDARTYGELNNVVHGSGNGNRVAVHAVQAHSLVQSAVHRRHLDECEHKTGRPERRHRWASAARVTVSHHIPYRRRHSPHPNGQDAAVDRDVDGVNGYALCPSHIGNLRARLSNGTN